MMVTGKKMRVESRGFVGMGKKDLGWRIKRGEGEKRGEKVGNGEHPMEEKKGKGRRGRKAKKRDGTD